VHGLCHRLPHVKGGKIVYTLYDTWSLYPNEYQSPAFQKSIGRRLADDLRKADLIVTISEWTRKKLNELGIVDSAKCKAIRLGVEQPIVMTDNTANSAILTWLNRSFALFVGRLENRKNIGHIIDAVLPFEELGLVLVGEPGFGYEENVVPQLARVPSHRLQVMSKLSNTDLALLYRNALVTIQPSWVEGFGLPILEAMSHGCPVITSNCSASAEVGVGGAALVDPSSPEESREVIARLRDDPQYRLAEKNRASLRSRQFSWDNYYNDLVKEYRELLNV
jgi:glycosyltransferase involved in cell wall biosynthesis